MKKVKIIIAMSVMFGFVPAAFSGEITSNKLLAGSGKTECSIHTKILKEKEANAPKNTIKVSGSVAK